HRYHFVSKRRTWTGARAYCRGQYTDMATVSGPADLEQLLATVELVTGFAWSGLYYVWDLWQWSLGGATSTARGEPNNYGGKENCMAMISSGLWADRSCTFTRYSVCYQGGEGGADQYFLVAQSKNWTEAQTFCREHYTDLTRVRSQSENELVRVTAGGREVWIGLFTNPWKWSDGDVSTFRPWYEGEPSNYGGIESCGTVNLQGSARGSWNDYYCNTTYAFFCYSGKLLRGHFNSLIGVNLRGTSPALRSLRPLVQFALVVAQSRSQGALGVVVSIAASYCLSSGFSLHGV
ncbi:CLC4K protein, partial [Atractosteus spatula]|nr:CLC4K protein [Atractosteus spatula]